MNTEPVEQITDTPPPTNGSLIHLARCTECDFATRFKPLPSGTGFSLVDSDLALGIGDNGRPVCPNGHGEMELADDRLPIEQAMEQAAEKLAEPQRLPYPSPPFNYEGVLHALCEKRHTIAALEKRVEDRRDLLKKAKDDLDEANAELGKMLDRFERDEQDRLAEIARREAAAAGHPEDTTLVRCAWEQAHPDEDCPVCSDPVAAERNGCGDTARDGSLHVEAADRLLYLDETAGIIALLEAAGLRIAGDVVNAWSLEDRSAVHTWAEQPDAFERPAILGTAHVAADFTTSEAVPGQTYQSCRECGARLLSNPTGSDNGESFEPYPAGTLVGTDCKGAGQHYNKPTPRSKKAKRRD